MTFRFKNWMAEHAAAPTFGCDEADLITFNSQVVELPSLDQRNTDDLDRAARLDLSPIHRERAIWELAYRRPTAGALLLKRYFDGEPVARVRANLLWLARKIAPAEASELIKYAMQDTDREVRDWAKLHWSEIQRTRFQSEYDRGVYVRGRSFDQTLPLEIAGFAVLPFGDVDVRAVLSPLWFAYIQGRVMACTRDESFMTRLTIEKLYAGYHPDGSDHYEIYPFAGKSWRSGEYDVEHRYLTNAKHRFYHSGRVEEDPTDFEERPMAAARSARTTGRLIQIEERGPDGEVDHAPAERRIVSHVKGQYFGWAHASMHHYLNYGDILPGTVQLVSPLELDPASVVNCYICGTFRGKVSDHNGDGLLDINEIVCHGHESGCLDYYGDGRLEPDPFA